MVSTISTPQDLLDDMGRFLGETLVGESLSSTAEMQRAELLQRLQPHIRRSGADIMSVPKIITQKTAMNGTNGSNVEEDYEELPAPIGLTPSPSSSSVRREDSLKINSSFKELKSTAHKHGPLWRKEKGVFYDPWRKYATVLHRHFLCMYSSEQGAKPYDSVDIKGFIARPVSNPRNEPKKNAIFEIVCPGKREYQFTARTAKDMQQWVAAICQASVLHIHFSLPPLPNLTTDKSVSRSVQDIRAPADSEGEIYDDVGSVINFNEKSELQQSDEQYYDDISDVHQGNARLASKPHGEVAPEEKCPPLPPLRLLPSVPQDDLSDQESVYDDIDVPKQHSHYPNVVCVDGVGGKNTEIQPGTTSKWGYKRVLSGTSTERGHKRVQPSTGTEERCAKVQSSTSTEGGHTQVQPGIIALHTKAQPHKTQYDAEEENKGEEEIYDDIEPSNEPLKATKSPVLQNKYSITNGDGIQNRAKILEKLLFKDGCNPKTKTSDQVQPNMNTLPKPIKNSGEDALLSLPRTPTAFHKSKSNTFHRNQQLTSNLYKHNESREKETAVSSSNTPLSPQPPELPPRSYLKR